ncbi:putative LOB domain-containing protein [Zostera marina]|uniref:Putative LOB domain-containing protein n=1 Tax=Zostera marina TaxID=29655 RepID=A0A0K9PUU3_ZOSMR|nr:putative LOB domain-containing protein [Zostera marina]
MLGCKSTAISVYRERPDETSKRIKRDSSSTTVVDRIGRRHGLGPSTGRLNNITPCAACKLLRRRCGQECPFSPYFSPHEPQKFASVHKVFGASNRFDAANSLVYEANVRIRDPVYGCMGAISTLQQQVQVLEAELNMVRTQILKLKYRRSSVNVLPTSHAAMVGRRGSSTPFPPPSGPLPPVTFSQFSDLSNSSSIYTLHSNSTDFSSITTENLPFFG